MNFFQKKLHLIFSQLALKTGQNPVVEHSGLENKLYLCGMNFTSQMRYNPETGEYEKYYRLKESYRNASGRACTRILLNVGFIRGLRPEEIRDISCGLTYKYEHQGDRELWDDQMAVYNEAVRQKIEEYWQRLVEEKKLDIIHQAFEASKAKAERRIDVDTLKHTDARDIDAHHARQFRHLRAARPRRRFRYPAQGVQRGRLVPEGEGQDREVPLSED